MNAVSHANIKRNEEILGKVEENEEQSSKKGTKVTGN